MFFYKKFNIEIYQKPSKSGQIYTRRTKFSQFLLRKMVNFSQEKKNMAATQMIKVGEFSDLSRMVCWGFLGVKILWELGACTICPNSHNGEANGNNSSWEDK